ncbi:hypothetical protein BKA67DRAFT_421461 [Truncatella angustata]|uniref:Uncharacterized protein n=1 Tax=Truncatella angustata TaxID=152316 RepID=A0A9P8RNZ3_9PEZI|nr:uncharacterized protein BKA67DRAFT_421461 [Truncatella angustata]KAH6646965.1 hypothetical protein BKA67DRAFT_421461 [Truncatella angustata]
MHIHINRMGCQCTRKKVTYSCLHSTTKVEKCWRDEWKVMNSCVGIFMPKCDKQPRHIRKKKRFGFCAECAENFGLPMRPHRYDRKYVERFLQYKEQMGWRKMAKDAKDIPFKVVLDDVDIKRIHGPQQSPMRVRAHNSSTEIPSGRLSIYSLDSAAVRGLRSDCYVSEDERSPRVLPLGIVPPGLKSAWSTATYDISSDSEEEDEVFEMVEIGIVSPASTNQSQKNGRKPIISSLSAHHEQVVTPGVLSRGHNMLGLDRIVETQVTLNIDAWNNSIVGQDVPAISEVPKRRRGKKYFEIGEACLTSPAGYQRRIKVRSRSFEIPVPPPKVFSKIFTGAGQCVTHGNLPSIDCDTCKLGIYMEAGVPTEEDETRRLYLSAPPIMVRCQVPRPNYECAVQAACFCGMGRETCLTCKEREQQAKIVGASFV